MLAGLQNTLVMRDLCYSRKLTKFSDQFQGQAAFMALTNGYKRDHAAPAENETSHPSHYLAINPRSTGSSAEMNNI